MFESNALVQHHISRCSIGQLTIKKYSNKARDPSTSTLFDESIAMDMSLSRRNGHEVMGLTQHNTDVSGATC